MWLALDLPNLDESRVSAWEEAGRLSVFQKKLTAAHPFQQSKIYSAIAKISLRRSLS